MARREEGGCPQRPLTDEQQSQTAFASKTLRAAVLLPVPGVGSALKARCGDAPASPQDPRNFQTGSNLGSCRDVRNEG